MILLTGCAESSQALLTPTNSTTASGVFRVSDSETTGVSPASITSPSGTIESRSSDSTETEPPPLVRLGKSGACGEAFFLPETVDMAAAVAAYPPEFPSTTMSADGRVVAAWTARDFDPSGVIGDPMGATREQGLEILDSLAASWAQAITEFHQMQWVVRDEVSWGTSNQTGDIVQ